MSIFQLLMLAASAFFAFKIYQHIQTLKDPEENRDNRNNGERGAQTFSIFDPESLIERADEAFENNDLDKAYALLSEANAKRPRDPEILFKLGFVLDKAGNNDDALEYLKESLEVDNDNPFAHNVIASVYRKDKEYASAKMHLQASLNVDDTNPVTYFNFGNLLVDMNHIEEAKQMYTRALELDPELIQAKEELEKL